MSRTATEALINRLRAHLEEAPPEYLAVYLFGSQARGEARPTSDVDLAFWRTTRSAPTLAEQPFLYADNLTSKLGSPVQLVELNRAPPDLIHEVLRDGIVLLERDRDARIVFEVSARQRYLDLRPFLLRYRGLEGQR